MGVENFDKIYVLFHIRKFNKKSECVHGHESRKLIGIFYSRNKALDILESYKKLEGFKNYPMGFHIQEYLVDEINKDNLNNLLGNKKIGKFSGIK